MATTTHQRRRPRSGAGATRTAALPPPGAAERAAPAPTVTAAEAAEVLEVERRKREAACLAEIEQALARHGCALDPTLTFSARGSAWNVDVVAR